LKAIFIVKAPQKIIRNLIRLWRSGDRASWYILLTKPTRCTNFSNLFLELNFTCFGQFPCPSSGVFHWTHSNGICHTGLLCVQWKTPDCAQRNCPKHVEFYSKNKFEKFVHLVGFIMRINWFRIITFQEVTNYFIVQSVTFNVKHIEICFIYNVRINVRERETHSSMN